MSNLTKLAAAAALLAATLSTGLATAAPICDPEHPVAGCEPPATHSTGLPPKPKYPDSCGPAEWGEAGTDGKWHCYPNNSGPPGQCPPPGEWVAGACETKPKPPPSEAPGPIDRGPLPPAPAPTNQLPGGPRQ
jgi:hypothetical protein